MRCMWHTLVVLGSMLLLLGCGNDRDPALDDPTMDSEEQRAQVEEVTVHQTADALSEAGLVDIHALPRGSEWREFSHSQGGRSYGYICDDRPVGYWHYTHANGRIAMRGAYLYGGLQHGPWETYWENGRPRARGSYLRGKHDGEWRFWHDNGRRAAVGRYSDGQRMGQWRSWWRSGRRQSHGSYIDNQRSGRWLFWDRDGNPISFTHSLPGTDMPEVMNPPVIQPDGRIRLED